MTHGLLASLIVASLAVVPVALACGDKFIVSTRKSPRKSAGAVKPASVLVLRNNAAPGTGAIRESDLERTLESVGHRVTIVGSLPEMGEAVRVQAFDVIMANADDVRAIRDIVRFEPKRPAILPVAHRASRDTIDDLRKTYPCVLSAPTKRAELLAAVDEVVSSRRR
jgi:CheY-like chemotaxis protein